MCPSGRGGAAVSNEAQDQLRALQQQLEAAQRKLEEDKAQVRWWCAHAAHSSLEEAVLNCVHKDHCVLTPASLCLSRQAEETIRELRAENEKLKYRVLHLVRNAREADTARPPPPPPPLQRFSTDPFNYTSPLST